jgi:ABC-type multidrug transport system fused ATPase/permease subunit
MQIIKKFLFLLTPDDRKKAVLLLLMISIMSFLEMLGVASILPFVTVLTNPDMIEKNFFLIKIYEISKKFGVQNNDDFLIFLGIAFFFFLVTTLIFKSLTIYTQLRFVMMREYRIGKRLIEHYLHQPYSWFLNKNSADLGKSILSEVVNVISGGMQPLLLLISNTMITLFLVGLLMVADTDLTLVVSITFLIAYGSIYLLFRKFLLKIGKDRLLNNQLRFTSVNEAFGAIKEIKVGGFENIYSERFSKPAKLYAKHQAAAASISQLPRYGLELIAFGGILLIILHLLSKTGTINNSLPIITLYAFVGYRLMPAIQMIYNSLTQLSFVSHSLNSLYNDFKNLSSSNQIYCPKKTLFKKELILKNISYTYPNSLRTSLNDINLKIKAKTTIGIVGVTGSGKTTVIDVILGLLNPQKGYLEIDGKVITKDKIRSWQSSIGYVPQHIYLSDDTLSSNIAFGIDAKLINQKQIEKAANIANIHEFIVKELPMKYSTIVGERGIRLSGGQRQRIGIARALYHNPEVLILDEATSALDNLTEKAVMNEIKKLNEETTIILIAHRLSTVKKCDKIFLLENGKLINSGSFDELIKLNYNFKMSNLNS